MPAKYQDVTLGQVEACINRMGGVDNFRRYISGQGHITFEKILSHITDVVLDGFGEFRAAEHFVEGTGPEAAVKIAGLNDVFKECLLGKIEEPIGSTTIQVRSLDRGLLGPLVRDEIGHDKEILTLGQVFGLLRIQARGEEAILNLDRSGNIFFVEDKGRAVLYINANWYSVFDGWFINAYEISPHNLWAAGTRVFSRAS